MMDYRIALAQINTTVGDLEGNTQKIIEDIKRAREQNADLVIFPELTITGYPPRDLLLKEDFIRKNLEKLEEIVHETGDISAVVGFVDSREKDIYNSGALIQDREIIGIQHKVNLSCDVFDEKRYFKSGKEGLVFDLDSLRIGIGICEDIQVENLTKRQAEKADLIVNISALPFYAGKTRIRRELISGIARKNNIPIVYLNLIGAQDDLVFDGGSYVFNEDGRLVSGCKRFEEDFLITELGKQGIIPEREENLIRDIYDALVLGIRDYARKNGFSKAVIGLSGGIDSSLTAVLAADALGRENILGISMPSRISSKESLNDAKKLSENLGIKHKVIPIQGIFDSYLETLREEFKDTERDVTEENIQARIRGNILMALSNKFGYLVLSTGNKSEMAVGYCTLYGDMSGGLAAISDLPKTTVYKLARYINEVRGREIIPRSIISKEPSAELREGQKDTESLPPYEVLDLILHEYIEKNKGMREITKLGFDEEVVRDVIRRVDHSQYKRQQAPLGIKITPKFGFGSRMPITNRYYTLE